MKKTTFSKLIQSLCLVVVLVVISNSTYSAVHYVRNAADVNSWNNIVLTGGADIISSDTPTIIPTDTYYFAKGTFTMTVTAFNATTQLNEPATPSITTGAIYGGFSGNEFVINLSKRTLFDKDGNGIVEPWEFANETILKGSTSFNDGTGSKIRLLTVTGGEVNGVTLMDHYYYGEIGTSTPYSGCVILGPVTSSPATSTDIVDNAGKMRYCTVKRLKAGGNGPVFITNSFSLVDNCLIEECKSNGLIANGGGGAIYIYPFGATISNSVLRNNIAVLNATGSGRGGAIYSAYNNNTTPYSVPNKTILNNCAIYNNTAGTNGGAIRIEGKSVASQNLLGGQVLNCSIVNNLTVGTSSPASAELIYEGQLMLNTIVVGDTKPEIRPQAVKNYFSNCVYGEIQGSITMLPNTNMSTAKVTADLKFQKTANFVGAMFPEDSGFVQATYDDIRSTNLKIVDAASPAVTTPGLTTNDMPVYFPSPSTIQPTATILSTDLTGVTRTSYTIGAYEFNLPVTYSNGNWSNSGNGPTASLEAVIDGTYNGPAFNAKKITVNAGKSLTVATGTMTIQNEVVNNGTMVIENNANLIQVNNILNKGAITVKRNSNPLLRLDYTLWSSPVAGQNLAAFSPLTSQAPNRFYTYDTANNQFDNTLNPLTTNFATGKGYLIRMPNDASASTAAAYAGQFAGVPTNGDVYYALSTAGNGFNLVGNPYPSPISITQLVSDNSAILTSTLYFWRTTKIGTAGTAYCTYNNGTFVTNNNSNTTNPNGVIQTGQGFFVKATTAGSLVFKNTQRVANTAGQFFKPKQVVSVDKVWLNATTAAGDFSQMAVTYSEGATTGVDSYDSESINDSQYALTSSINNGEYTIQGRPAFDVSDVVPLNFKTPVAGQYTIAIDHAEGVFASGQSVVLVDAVTGTATDLTASAYTFTAPAGTANGRFSLQYQKAGISPSDLNTSLAVYKNKGIVCVNAGNTAIENIKVYDIQGKLVQELKNVNSSVATLDNLKVSNQVLVVQITLQDNQVITKKIVN